VVESNAVLVKADNTQLLTALNAKYGRLATAGTWSAKQTFGEIEVTGITTLKGDTTIGDTAGDSHTVNGPMAFNHGASATGTSTGAGLTAQGGATSGNGINATGGPSSIGVYGIGGTGDSIGVRGDGKGTEVGIWGNAAGTGAGVEGSSSGGVGGRFFKSSTRGAVNIVPDTAPSAPQNGDIWIDSGVNELRIHINGVTKTVTLV